MTRHFHKPEISRRQCLSTIAGALAGTIGCAQFSFANQVEQQKQSSKEKQSLLDTKADKFPPIRQITKGPRYHWFGYYDKLEFDPSGRYVLGNEVSFQHRRPEPSDILRVGMVDLEDNDRWIDLGKSNAWSWQQACMLQWLPGSKSEVIWNDREEEKLVSRILDVFTRKMRTVLAPIYTVHPNGQLALSTDFFRMRAEQPGGYGYAGQDPYADEDAPAKSGITRVDLKTGKEEIVISLADVANFGDSEGSKTGRHRIEHILYNRDGSRFVFMDRFTLKGTPRASRDYLTRFITASADGKDMYLLDDSGMTSHFDWRDNDHIIAWTRPRDRKPGFYIFKDKTTEMTLIGDGIMTRDGHETFLPGNKWLLSDTYPDKNRNQNPYLYNLETKKHVPLGHFHVPEEYPRGEFRIDTHPRYSPNGKKVVIDSPHNGDGRQMYLIDISEIVS